MSNNQNVTPEQELASPPVESTPESIRQEHIKHEASVKSIGILYYLGASAFIVCGIASFLSQEEEALFIVKVLIGIIFLGLAFLHVCVGRGLRTLRRWSRGPTIILSIIGLLGFPIGTLINGYILYLVLSRKGVVVFSDEYKAVIEATPEIRYKTSIVVWIFLAILLIVVLGLALIGVLLSN